MPEQSFNASFVEFGVLVANAIAHHAANTLEKSWSFEQLVFGRHRAGTLDFFAREGAGEADGRRRIHRSILLPGFVCPSAAADVHVPYPPYDPPFSSVTIHSLNRSACSTVVAWPCSYASTSSFGAVMTLYAAYIDVGGHVSSL